MHISLKTPSPCAVINARVLVASISSEQRECKRLALAYKPPPSLVGIFVECYRAEVEDPFQGLVTHKHRGGKDQEGIRRTAGRIYRTMQRQSNRS